MGTDPENPAWRRSPHSSPREGKPITWPRRTGHSIERKIKVCAMQKAKIVLSMLGQKAKEDSTFVFDRLYRNLHSTSLEKTIARKEKCSVAQVIEKYIPQWVLRMSSLRRKTLVVCEKCHDEIHAATSTKFLREML
jgi:hypothetical protein